MLLRCDLSTGKDMPLFGNLSSDCNDTPVDNLSDEMSIDDLPVASSSGFQNAENVDSSSDENLEKECQKSMEKR
ncbi:hypothetical protein NPIL_205342 [Nephila pilipes]|nr:hypothetical protein NPIL_205342 [Nephila pilipes]